MKEAGSGEREENLRGAWGAGRASRIRWRCRVRTIVRSERTPSDRNTEAFDGEVAEGVELVSVEVNE